MPKKGDMCSVIAESQIRVPVPECKDTSMIDMNGSRRISLSATVFTQNSPDKDVAANAATIQP